MSSPRRFIRIALSTDNDKYILTNDKLQIKLFLLLTKNTYEKKLNDISSGSHCAHRHRGASHYDSVSPNRREGRKLRPVQHLRRSVHCVYVPRVYYIFCCAVSGI